MVMSFAVAVLWAILQAGASLSWAPYAAVTAAGLVIIGIECLIPYRESWHPNVVDLADDGAFMIVVQVLLPLALSWKSPRRV